MVSVFDLSSLWSYAILVNAFIPPDVLLEYCIGAERDLCLVYYLYRYILNDDSECPMDYELSLLPNACP